MTSTTTIGYEWMAPPQTLATRRSGLEREIQLLLSEFSMLVHCGMEAEAELLDARLGKALGLNLAYEIEVERGG